MKATVVIPTYNRPGLAGKLKQQISFFQPECEVIIVDQSGSHRPNTSLAKNQGASKATGEIVIFFDDDVEITADTIKAHLLAYQDPNVVGVAGRVINDGEVVPGNTEVSAGEVNSFLTKFDKNFWSTRRQGVEFVYGCNMSFRKKVLEAVGGFDESLPTPLSAFEEIDLSFKVRRLGLLVFVPNALVYHHRASAGGTRLDQTARNHQYYRSYGRIISRYVSFPFNLVSIAVLFVRIFKESYSSLPFFFKGLFNL